MTASYRTLRTVKLTQEQWDRAKHLVSAGGYTTVTAAQSIFRLLGVKYNAKYSTRFITE